MNPLLHSSLRQIKINGYGVGLGALEDLAAELNCVGFGSLTGMVNAKALSSLSQEALERRREAKLVSGEVPCFHHAHLSKLGNCGVSFLTSCLMEGLLSSLFREPLVLATDASCYTYYGPGDCLGPHLDDPDQCLITVILYVDVKSPCQRRSDTGLQLRIRGGSGEKPGAVRAVLTTVRGMIVVGLGSEHWHERPQLQTGEHVTALTACFSRRV